MPARSTDVSSAHQRRWIRRSGIVLLGAGIATLATLVGSVIFVRATAYGSTYSEAEVPAAPVGLVLGAQVYPDGTPSPFLAGRLDLAHRLFDAGKIKVILVSGDNMAPEYDEPTAMRRYLVAAGVPADKIVADYAGFDTYDSCVRARQIFGVDDLVVVTQSYHLPRAVATCRSVGVRAVGVGDETGRRYSGPWQRGMVREQFASVKTVWDLLSRRQPVLGARETSVQLALQA